MSRPLPPKPVLRARAFVMTPGDVKPVEACEAASVFVAKPRPPPTHAMWHGIHVHRFLDEARSLGRAHALKRVQMRSRSAYTVCAALDLDALPDGDREAGIAIEPAAGTAMFADYADAEAERHVYLRTDLVFYGEHAEAPRGAKHHMLDWKTGERAYDPATGDQWKVGAVGVWLIYGKPELVGAHAVNITIGLPRWRTWEYSATECGFILRRLRSAHARMLEVRAEHAEGFNPGFTPGEHCRTCRARDACPSAPKEAA